MLYAPALLTGPVSVCSSVLSLVPAGTPHQSHEIASLDFYCTDDQGHTCSATWYYKGAAFLLQSVHDAKAEGDQL